MQKSTQTVYNVTTDRENDEISQAQTKFPGSQNTKSSGEERLTNEFGYPPFVDQVHGLSLVLTAKSIKLKIFWWLVFIACTCCGMVTTAFVIIEYIQVPTATSVTIKLVSYLKYASSILICLDSVSRTARHYNMSGDSKCPQLCAAYR
jgi:hypothetical protein